MKGLAETGVYLILAATSALGLYELTAKSPSWLGQPLPGWQITLRCEQVTGWQQPTGILPVDKFLHESLDRTS